MKGLYNYERVTGALQTHVTQHSWGEERHEQALSYLVELLDAPRLVRAPADMSRSDASVIRLLVAAEFSASIGEEDVRSRQLALQH